MQTYIHTRTHFLESNVKKPGACLQLAVPGLISKKQCESLAAYHYFEGGNVVCSKQTLSYDIAHLRLE